MTTAVLLAVPWSATGCPSDDAGSDDAATSGPGSTGPAPTTSASADSSGGSGSSGPATTGDSGSDSDSGDDSGSGDTTGQPVVCGTPAQLGVLSPSEGNAVGFAVDGTTVYLASTSGGLFVVDASDPSMPAEIGQYDFGTGNLAHRVAYDGTTIFVGLRGSGWVIVDAADPSMILPLSEDDTVEARDIAVLGATMYVADNNGLLSYDVTDPGAPVPLTTDLVLPGSTESVEIAGDVAFVASIGHGLSAVDISDPGALMELSSLQIGNGSERLAVEGDLVYVSHSEGLSIVDASDPSMLVEVGSYVRDRAAAVDTDGTKVFLTGDDTASIQVPFLAVLDAADPQAVIELDITNDDFADPVWLVFANGTLYATVEDDDSLHIFDACPQ